MTTLEEAIRQWLGKPENIELWQTTIEVTVGLRRAGHDLTYEEVYDCLVSIAGQGITDGMSLYRYEGPASAGRRNARWKFSTDHTLYPMTIGFAQAMEKLQAMTYAARQQAIDGGDDLAREHLRALARMADELADATADSSIDRLLAQWAMEDAT